jgi:uncharacterized membrane protein
MPVKKFFGKSKQRFNRGATWLNMPVTTIGILAANIRLFEGVIIGYGYPSNYIWALYVMCGPVYVGLCYAVGVIDDIYGIWREENNYSWAVTPVAAELCEDVKKIKRHLNIE